MLTISFQLGVSHVFHFNFHVLSRRVSLTCSSFSFVHSISGLVGDTACIQDNKGLLLNYVSGVA